MIEAIVHTKEGKLEWIDPVMRIDVKGNHITIQNGEHGYSYEMGKDSDKIELKILEIQ